MSPGTALGARAGSSLPRCPRRGRGSSRGPSRPGRPCARPPGPSRRLLPRPPETRARSAPCRPTAPRPGVRTPIWSAAGRPGGSSVPRRRMMGAPEPPAFVPSPPRSPRPRSRQEPGPEQEGGGASSVSRSADLLERLRAEDGSDEIRLARERPLDVGEPQDTLLERPFRCHPALALDLEADFDRRACREV
jgi:hypothetical protein